MSVTPAGREGYVILLNAVKEVRIIYLLFLGFCVP